MLMFLQNWALVLAMLVGLGLAGGFAILPFRRHLPFAVLLAPLAGLLLVALGALVLYVVFKLPMRTAQVIAWTACGILTGVAWSVARRQVPNCPLCFLGVVVVATAAIATGLHAATSIHLGDWGFLYLDGSDQLGYAHLADWLNTRLITEPPVESPALPYHSWPYFMFSSDPRFGTLTVLALVSQVSGRSGMFSYDLACALVLTLTSLALAATFSRARLMLVVVVVGLLTCHWFDYGRGGFFAKTVSFPTSFFVAGLYLATAQGQFNALTTAILVILTASAATMQSGESTALFLAVLGIPFLAATALYRSLDRARSASNASLAFLRDSAIILLLLIAVAIVASGTIARPLRASFPDWGFDWSGVFSRITELESHYADLSGLTAVQLQGAAYLMLVLWLGLAVLAAVRRESTATALLVGPMVLLLILWLEEARAMTYQMIGVFYPLALCGAAGLVRPGSIRLAAFKSPRSVQSAIVLGLTVVGILLHQPRFVGAVNRYCRNAPLDRQFSMEQMNGLTRAIGKETVDVALDWRGLPVLVELGRRALALQWTPEAWAAILGYRPGWEPPSYGQPGTLRLVPRPAPIGPGEQIVYETNQFRLIRVNVLDKRSTPP